MENSKGEFSPLPSALGNPAKSAGFPHFHSDDGDRISSRHSLLENQCTLQEALHVGSTEDLLFEPLLHRPP